MKRPRKRAPGGGRKQSIGGITPPLTIRLDRDLRAKLDAVVAAKKKEGKKSSVSQELQARLRRSFGNEPIFSYLISEIANQTHLQIPIQTGWSADPFFFKAFRLAVSRLLEILQPGGEIQSPLAKMRPALSDALPPHELQLLKDRWGQTPEVLADKVVDSILQSLRLSETTHFGELFEQQTRPLTEEFKYELNQMSRARRDLGIQFVKPKEDKP